jgi:pyruvate/2-oxoacid:ferredoxin oxidoreductase beta subunit
MPEDNTGAISESGHLGCPGCGEAISLRLVLGVIGDNAIMVVPACCASYVDGIWPHSAARIPLLHVAFGTTVAAAAGIRAALEVKGQNRTCVLAWAGGSGAFDSGIRAISSAADRNEDILYVCYNNESYDNIDYHCVGSGENARSSNAASRRRSPLQKNVMEIMAAHHIPFCATACVAYPEDLVTKVKKAISIPGFKFLHLLSPCPTHWEIPSELSIEMSRAAVQTRVFPLYEIDSGGKYTINVQPEAFTPVTKFLSRQGRFAALNADSVRNIQNQVELQWRRLLRKVEMSQTFAHRPVKTTATAAAPGDGSPDKKTRNGE